MVILGRQNEITDFLMILAWASPFKDKYIEKVEKANSTTPNLFYTTAIIISF